jgi:hypothetical protein
MYWEGFLQIKSKELQSGPTSINPEPQHPLVVSINPERKSTITHNHVATGINKRKSWINNLSLTKDYENFILGQQ